MHMKSRKKGRSGMDAGFWLMFLASIMIGAFVAHSYGTQKALDGLSIGGQLLMVTLPKMIFAFAVAGLIQVVIPTDLISQWLGEDSGIRGLLVGTVAGTITPGGPMMHFPIVASLLNSGAGAGPIISYLTAWSLLGFHRLIIWEFPILGMEITVARFLASLVLPPLVGFVGAFIFHSLPGRLPGP